jgi:hypothetical protein
MAGRVPILGQDPMRKVMDEPINDGNGLISGWDFESTPEAEVVLNIDDKETIS